MSKLFTVLAIVLGQVIGIALSMFTESLKKDGKENLAYIIDITIGMVLLVGLITVMIIGKIKGFL